ncbi:winged helix-turn-helix transcriptional regulator [Rugosimonospora africana]|uniref:HTH hxlR-type domain-containing protein n=1 Tax=Rugosimonospora africana TaxID=556532 RepID=A0A8J3QSX0_9ACTN|nr:winged helix-turn-helix transcriptional regulator [Rugosimonospora africana]GIH16263.1 hypothetical protein Raf01_44350 [Rugosimonospora africana]
MTGFTASPRPPRPGDGEHPQNRPGQAVLDLIRRPYVAEILAALDAGPHSLTELRRATGASRRLAAAALGALAAHGTIARQRGAGSWDSLDRDPVRYRVTPAGEELIDCLFLLDAWLAVYDIDPPE